MEQIIVLPMCLCIDLCIGYLFENVFSSLAVLIIITSVINKHLILGLEQKKKKCYTRLTSNLNRIVDQYDRESPVKTLKKIADIVKLGQAVDMPPEEEHLLTY